jgi:hypothetical protein
VAYAVVRVALEMLAVAAVLNCGRCLLLWFRVEGEWRGWRGWWRFYSWRPEIATCDTEGCQWGAVVFWHLQTWRVLLWLQGWSVEDPPAEVEPVTLDRHPVELSPLTVRYIYCPRCRLRRWWRKAWRKMR